jgi:hypothetical protein
VSIPAQTTAPLLLDDDELLDVAPLLPDDDALLDVAPLLLDDEALLLDDAPPPAPFPPVPVVSMFPEQATRSAAGTRQVKSFFMRQWYPPLGRLGDDAHALLAPGALDLRVVRSWRIPGALAVSSRDAKPARAKRRRTLRRRPWTDPLRGAERIHLSRRMTPRHRRSTHHPMSGGKPGTLVELDPIDALGWIALDEGAACAWAVRP